MDLIKGSVPYLIVLTQKLAVVIKYKNEYMYVYIYIYKITSCQKKSPMVGQICLQDCTTQLRVGLLIYLCTREQLRTKAEGCDQQPNKHVVPGSGWSSVHRASIKLRLWKADSGPCTLTSLVAQTQMETIHSIVRVFILQLLSLGRSVINILYNIAGMSQCDGI